METAPSGPLQQDAALLPKYQSRRVYRAIRVGEVLCAIIALSCWYLAWFFGRGIPEGFSLQMILPFALFIIGLVAALTIIVLQLLAAAAITPTAAQVLERDRRPPIIYLRSFSLDSLFGGNQEGEICKIFGGCGPVVAIGRPGEVFGNPNGAARLYVSNDRWQGTILRLLDDARAVLLVAGKTTGVAWELRTVLSRVDPLKVLIIADGLDELQLAPRDCEPDSEPPPTAAIRGKTLLRGDRLRSLVEPLPAQQRPQDPVLLRPGGKLLRDGGIRPDRDARPVRES